MKYNIGQRVKVRDEVGIVRYIGETKFAPGVWYGVELDRACGKNNGTVGNVCYFECTNKAGLYGVFVKEALLEEIGVDSFKSNLSEKKKLKERSNHANEKEKEKEKENIVVGDFLDSKVKLQEFKELAERAEMHQRDNEFLQQLKTQLEIKLSELTNSYLELKEKHAAALEELEINHELEKELSQVSVREYSAQDLKRLVENNRYNESQLRHLEEVVQEKDKHLALIKEQLENSRLGIMNLQNNLSQREKDIAMLKNRMEAVSDLEAMAERLSLENVSLKRTEKELRTAIMELNEIHDIDKKLEENHINVEEQLRLELAHCKKSLDLERDSNHKLKRKLEITVSKTKVNDETPLQSVSMLNSQIQALQDQVAACNVSIKQRQIRIQILELKYHLICERVDNSKLYKMDKRFVDLIFDLRSLELELTVLIKETGKDLVSEKLFCVEYSLSAYLALLGVIIKVLEYNYNSELSSVLLLPSVVEYADDVKAEINQVLRYLIESKEREEEKEEKDVDFDFKSCLQKLLDFYNFLYSQNESLKMSIPLQLCLINTIMSNTISYGEKVFSVFAEKKFTVEMTHLVDLSHIMAEFRSIFESICDKELETDISIDAPLNTGLVLTSLINWATAMNNIYYAQEDFDNDNTCSELEVAWVDLCKWKADVPTTYHVEKVVPISIYDIEIDSLPNNSINPTEPNNNNNNNNNNSEFDTCNEIISQKKESEIQDLKLNIALLEQNLKVVTKKTSEESETFQKTLTLINEDLKEKSGKISQLEKEKLALERDLAAVENDTLLHSADMDDLEFQIKCNERKQRLETLIDLKREAKYNYEEKISWSWNESKSSFWKPVSRFQNLAKQLRNLAEGIQMVQIESTNNPKWKLKSESPSILNAYLEEQFFSYQSAKKDLFSKDSSIKGGSIR
ncbi:NIP100 [Candida oxycetoniae]|uniref:NIP100 n=1 Tax=Candida oxycetoniae TaxID=497107 RepID=A0AAI9WZK3_9ASCO|nr:NIP100 [Candida oxycetoniae]KAI3405995.2 NIP100 [Candida oxycetoniae]